MLGVSSIMEFHVGFTIDVVIKTLSLNLLCISLKCEFSLYFIDCELISYFNLSKD